MSSYQGVDSPMDQEASPLTDRTMASTKKNSKVMLILACILIVALFVTFISCFIKAVNDSKRDNQSATA